MFFGFEGDETAHFKAFENLTVCQMASVIPYDFEYIGTHCLHSLVALITIIWGVHFK